MGGPPRHRAAGAGALLVRLFLQCCPVLRFKWSLKRNSTISMTQRAWRSPSRPGEGLGMGPGGRTGEGAGGGQVRGWVRDRCGPGENQVREQGLCGRSEGIWREVCLSGEEHLRLSCLSGSCTGRMWMERPSSSLGSRTVTTGFRWPSPSPAFWCSAPLCLLHSELLPSPSLAPPPL